MGVASKTLTGHDFPNGTLVAAYPRENLVDGGPPSGSPVDTSTVAGGALTFDGLTEGRRYVAYALGEAWAFFMEPGRADLLSPIRGEEAAEMRGLSDRVLPFPVDASDTVADQQMLRYVQSTGKFIYVNPWFVDPVDGYWGDVGTGVDSRPAIQAAFNFAICGNTVDPALPENGGSLPMASRAPRYPIKFGPRPDVSNAYRVDSKVKAYAADGIVIEGMGAVNSELRAGSIGQDYILDVNGCHASTVRDIGFSTHGSATVTACINHDCISTVAKNSGEFATFENIWMRGSHKYGALIGGSGTSNGQDCYHGIWEHCIATGAQRIAKNFTADTASGSPTLSNVSTLTTGTSGLTNGDSITGENIPAGTTILSGAGTATITMSANATGTKIGGGVRRGGWDSSATLWQAGFKVGGAFGAGNVLSHTFHNCNSQGYSHGVEWSSVGIRWRDGNTIANAVDFYTTAMNYNDPSIIEGDRSESSERFLIANGGATGVQLSVRDIAFNGSLMAADATPVQYTMAGQFILENFNIVGMVAARIGVDQVKIKIGAADGAQSVEINGLTIPCIDESKVHPRYWLNEAGTTRRGTWTVRNVKGYTDAVTVAPIDRPIAGPLSNRDRTAAIFTFTASTTNLSTTLTSGSSTATASLRAGMTVTHPNLPAGTTILSHISGNDFLLSAAATATGSGTAVVTRYPMHPSDRVIAVTATATGGHTVDLLPVAGVHPGHRVTIVDESGTLATNNVTLDGSGAETIRTPAGSAATLVMATNGQAVTLMATVTGWSQI